MDQPELGFDEFMDQVLGNYVPLVDDTVCDGSADDDDDIPLETTLAYIEPVDRDTTIKTVSFKCF